MPEIPSADYIAAKRKPRISQKDEERLDEDVRKELSRLRMENEYLKKLNALVRKKEKSLTKRRWKFNLRDLLSVSGIPRSSYYYFMNDASKTDKYDHVQPILKRIFHKNKSRYGYSSYRGNIEKTAPNLLERNFEAKGPNEKWVTDITEYHLFGHKLYLSPILDLYNGEIVSYVLSDHPRYSQVATMLENAFKKIPDGSGLILHSDQGWQYRMNAYHEALIAKGIRQNMSRKGNCLDNAVMENFFGHLKSELLYNQTFYSLDHFISELHEYMWYYNNERIKKKLDYMTPIEFRLLNPAA